MLFLLAVLVTANAESCRNLNKRACDSFPLTCIWTEGSFCNYLDTVADIAEGDGSATDEDGFVEERAVAPFACSMFKKEVHCERQTHCIFNKQILTWGEQCIDKPITLPPTESDSPTKPPTRAPTHPVCSELRFNDCKNYDDEKCVWTAGAFCMDATAPYVEPFSCNLFLSKSLCENYSYTNADGETTNPCAYNLARDHGTRCADATPSPTADPTAAPVDAPTPSPTRVNCLDLSRNDCKSTRYTDLCEWTLDAFCNDVVGGPNHQEEPYNCNLFEMERDCEKYEVAEEQHCMYNSDLEFGLRCIPFTAEPTNSPTNVFCFEKTKRECLKVDTTCEWTQDSFCNYPAGALVRHEEPYACNLFEQRRQCHAYLFNNERACMFDGGRDFGDRCIDFVPEPTHEPTAAPTKSPVAAPVQVDCTTLNKRDCQNTENREFCQYRFKSFCDDKAFPMAEPVACNLFTRKHACESYKVDGVEQCKFNRQAEGDKCSEYSPTAQPTADPTNAPVTEATPSPILACNGLNRKDCSKLDGCTFRLNSFCDFEDDDVRRLPEPFECSTIVKKGACNDYIFLEDTTFFGCVFDRSQPVGQKCSARDEPTAEPTAMPTVTPETPPPTELDCFSKTRKHCVKSDFDGLCIWMSGLNFCDDVSDPLPEPYNCNIFKRKQSCHRYRFGDDTYAADYRRCNYVASNAFGERCVDNDLEGTNEPTANPTADPTSEPTARVCNGKSKMECGRVEECEYVRNSWCDDKEAPVILEKETGGFACNLFRKKFPCHDNLNNEGHRLCYYDMGEDDHALRCKDKAAPTSEPTANPTAQPTFEVTLLDCLAKSKNECRNFDQSKCQWIEDSWCQDVENPIRQKPYDCSWFTKHHACVLQTVSDSDNTPLCMYNKKAAHGSRCTAYTAPPTAEPTASPTDMPTSNPTQQICENKSKTNCRSLDGVCTWTMDTWCEGPFETDADGNKVLMAGGFKLRTPYECSDVFSQAPCAKIDGCRFDKKRDYFLDPVLKKAGGGGQCYRPEN